MAETELSQILDMFDNYITLIENPDIGSKINTENISKVFDCCQFVEAAVEKAEQENKSKSLENHLRGLCTQEKRTKIYTVSQFASATDTLLEVFLKNSAIPTAVVNKLLELYLQNYGSEKLNSLLGSLLTDSMCTNTILESLTEIGIPETAIEDEALLIAWKDEAEKGNQNEVSFCINAMLNDNKLEKIVEFVSFLTDDSIVKKLIMQVLTAEALNCTPNFFFTLSKIDRKLLLKLLRDREFQLYFVDGVFFFGRNMERIDDEWCCEHEFTYERLVWTMKILLNASNDIAESTRNRLEIAKEHVDGAIWYDVKRDARR